MRQWCLRVRLHAHVTLAMPFNAQQIVADSAAAAAAATLFVAQEFASGPAPAAARAAGEGENREDDVVEWEGDLRASASVC